MEMVTRATNLQRSGRHEQAMQVMQHALRLDPDNYVATAGIAQLAMSSGQTEIAERYAWRGRTLKPDGFECLTILSECFHASGRLDEAIDCKQRAASVQPDNDRVHFNLGVLCEKAGRFDDARAAYWRAWQLNERNLEALGNLVVLELADGQTTAALAHSQAAHRLRRGSAHVLVNADHLPALPEAESMTSRFKLRMDHEQLCHLRANNLISEAADPLIAALAKAIIDCDDEPDDDHAFRRQHPRHRREPHWQLLNQCHNRPIHVPDITLPNGPLINPELDVQALQRTYFDSSPQVVVIDDFLADEALQAMRAFCQQATIWYDLRRNYLGAYLTDGFASALTLGIADGLRAALPDIFSQHPLSQAWAYKYGPRLNGIGMHADAAAVNCNFWITGDEYNLRPDQGGLLVYRKEAPLDWDFGKFNNDTEAMHRYLGDEIHTPIRIPHRSNRIVIFNANLFHQSDDIHFADCFEGRRYNITLLYGHRGNG